MFTRVGVVVVLSGSQTDAFMSNPEEPGEDDSQAAAAAGPREEMVEMVENVGETLTFTAFISASTQKPS